MLTGVGTPRTRAVQTTYSTVSLAIKHFENFTDDFIISIYPPDLTHGSS